MDVGVPADHIVKIEEREKRDKYLDLTRELKKTVEYEDGDDNSSNCLERFPKGCKEKKDWMNWKSEEKLRPSRPQQIMQITLLKAFPFTKLWLLHE